MKDKYIKITVSGLAKSGKTTIAELIGDALSDYGFDITLETDADGHQIDKGAVQAVLDSGIRVMIQERDVADVRKKTWNRQPKQRPEQAAAPPPPKSFSGVDETIPCVGCGTDFVFTVGEQEWFALHKLNKAPKRCKTCLSHKKNRTNGRAA